MKYSREEVEGKKELGSKKRVESPKKWTRDDSQADVGL